MNINLFRNLRYVVLGFSLTLMSACGSSDSKESAPKVADNGDSQTVEPIPLPETVPYTLVDEISPNQAVADMGVGINLGNTFDAPHEGDWALPAKESYIDAFYNAGFKHVRIPVTWHEHTSLESPYTVDESFIARVEEVVDWALARGFYVIINAHHESWLKNNYQDQKNKNRLDSIWIQVAAHFKEKPAKLMFELLNEPNGMTIEDVNEANKRLLTIIRNENPNRLVVFSGHGFTPIDALLEADIPDVQDGFLIGNFHSYDPWGFAGQCQQSWGTEQDKADLRHVYQRASDWVSVNQIPVMVNEFGAAKYDFTQPDNVCDLSERLAYLAHHVALAKEFGIAGTFWDDGGSFSSYDRSNNSWGPEKDVLVEHNNQQD